MTIEASITGLTAAVNTPIALGSGAHFTASVTGGTNVVYTWDFGDGTSGSGAAPDHTYAHPGNFTARITATNAAGSVSKDVALVVLAKIYLPLTLVQ